jgi:hypothetical protein
MVGDKHPSVTPQPSLRVGSPEAALTEINTEAFDWDREKIKQVLQELSQLPDFDNLPIPEEWGKIYDIPITSMKTMDLRSYLHSNKQVRFNAKVDTYEVREPVPGGVRTVPDMEPMTLILQEQNQILKDESGNEIVVPLLGNSDTSTKSNMTEQLEYQVDAPTNVSPSSDDEVHTIQPVSDLS